MLDCLPRSTLWSQSDRCLWGSIPSGSAWLCLESHRCHGVSSLNYRCLLIAHSHLYHVSPSIPSRPIRAYLRHTTIRPTTWIAFVASIFAFPRMPLHLPRRVAVVADRKINSRVSALITTAGHADLGPAWSTYSTSPNGHDLISMEGIKFRWWKHKRPQISNSRAKYLYETWH